MNWAKAEEVFHRLLDVRGHPVGVKMIRDGNKIPQMAERPASPLTVCQLYQLARLHSKTVYAERKDIFCGRGVSAIGLEAVPEDIIKGIRDEWGKAPDVKAAERLQRNIPRLPLQEGYIGVCMFPLRSAKVEPDMAIITGTAGQMLRLCQAAVYSQKGERLMFQTSGTQGICADCIATVLTTKKPNMTSPCYGARYFAEFEEDDLLFAFPINHLEGLVDGLKATHKGGYVYPILHEVEMTPFGSASLTIARSVSKRAKHGKEIRHRK